MNNWYKTAGPFNAGENEYSADVKVSALQSAPDNSWDAEIGTTISFKYKIELEYRTWGIKDIIVKFDDVISVGVVVSYSDVKGNEIKREDRSIMIDMSKLSVDYVEGHGIWVQDVDLYLTNDIQIDYKLSSISVVRNI